MILSVGFPMNFSGLSTVRGNRTTDVVPAGVVEAGSIMGSKYCRSGDAVNSRYVMPCWGEARSGDNRRGDGREGNTRGRGSTGGCLESTRGLLLGTSSRGLYGSTGGCFFGPSSRGLYGSTGDCLLSPSSGGLFHWYRRSSDSILGEGSGCLLYRWTGDRDCLLALMSTAKVPLRASWLVYLGIETGWNSMKVEERSGSGSGSGGTSAGASVGFFSCSLLRM